jgi:hypothetical protein
MIDDATNDAIDDAIDDDDVVGDALDNLVTQFSSALDFYRELVQNSIDAGSSTVEVWLEFIADESGHTGTIAIHVDDYGDGMTEAIIDNELTQLFSSTKDDDLTKIGKFGIGFVSIFAIGPKAVIVHTGRSGEYWEGMFHEDRSFSKTRVEDPVDGTQITLFLPGDRAGYRDLVHRSRETVRRWCRHSEVEVTFEDRSRDDSELATVNEAFSVEGRCSVDADLDGALITMAFSGDPVHGFYNRGLMLAEVRGDPDVVPARLQHVSFKIKSGLLSHTLSRETIVRDEDYERALQRLIRVADGELRSELLDALAQLHASEIPWNPHRVQDYLELAGFLAAEQAFGFHPGEHAVLRTVDGRAVSLDDIVESVERDGRVYLDSHLGHLGERLLDSGTPVLLDGGPGGSPSVRRVVTHAIWRHMRGGVLGLMRRVLVGDLRKRAAALVARPAEVLVAVEPGLEGPWDERLIDAAQRTLELQFPLEVPQDVHTRDGGRHALTERDIRLGYGKIVGARLPSVEPPGPLFVIGRHITSMMAIPPAGAASYDPGPRPEAAVNVRHPQFRTFAALYESRPAMATYCLAKSLVLFDDRRVENELDQRLMHYAHQVARGLA